MIYLASIVILIAILFFWQRTQNETDEIHKHPNLKGLKLHNGLLDTLTYDPFLYSTAGCFLYGLHQMGDKPVAFWISIALLTLWLGYDITLQTTTEVEFKENHILIASGLAKPKEVEFNREQWLNIKTRGGKYNNPFRYYLEVRNCGDNEIISTTKLNLSWAQVKKIKDRIKAS